MAGTLIAIWYLDEWQNPVEQISIAGEKIWIADGDSFAIGTRKFRLKGIDAPEYKQSCKDANGVDWPCGKTARAALEKLLTRPDLSCEAQAYDRYARSLASCRTASSADIAGAQVRAGMAVSDAYYGIRRYSEEEDEARAAKRGIWQGIFVQPNDFREM
jgi:endonuclease YncB( thermonuclease family)